LSDTNFIYYDVVPINMNTEPADVLMVYVYPTHIRCEHHKLVKSFSQTYPVLCIIAFDDKNNIIELTHNQFAKVFDELKDCMKIQLLPPYQEIAYYNPHNNQVLMVYSQTLRPVDTVLDISVNELLDKIRQNKGYGRYSLVIK